MGEGCSGREQKNITGVERYWKHGGLEVWDVVDRGKVLRGGRT